MTAKKKIQIKRLADGAILFEVEAQNTKEALETAVSQLAHLSTEIMRG